jgi:hypothetical protein
MEKVDSLAEALRLRPTLFILRKKSGPVEIATQTPVKSAILQTCMKIEMRSREADGTLFLLVIRSSIDPLYKEVKACDFTVFDVPGSLANLLSATPTLTVCFSRSTKGI